MNQKIAVKTNFVDSSQVDWETDYSIAYVADNQIMLIVNLLGMGAGLFFNAKRIAEYEIFKTLNVPREQIDEKIAQGFALEATVDMFRIVTCFDNYMKAVLLAKNFIVHKIKNEEKYKATLNEQKKRPIKIEEVLGDNNFREGMTVPFVINPLSANTIDISTMLLKKAYTDEICLPEDIKKIIKEMVDYRNKHHFYIQEVFVMNKKVVSDLERLVEFMNSDFKSMLDKYTAQLESAKGKQAEIIPNPPL